MHIDIVIPSCNPYGTPLFKGMMERIENKYDGYFYGYCNGDLLFHSSLLQALHVICQRIQNSELEARVCIESIIRYSVEESGIMSE